MANRFQGSMLLASCAGLLAAISRAAEPWRASCWAAHCSAVESRAPGRPMRRARPSRATSTRPRCWLRPPRTSLEGGNTMAKLRHLALYTEDPEATAAFYKDAFEMFEVGRTDSSIAEGIYLSDGTLNVAVLHYRSKEGAAKFGSSSKCGLSHFGFWVDDMEATRDRLRGAGAQH